MAASKGQIVEYQISTGRWLLAQVAAVVSTDVLNLLVYPDGSAAAAATDLPGGVLMVAVNSVALGSSVGQWRVLALPAATSAAFTLVATAGTDPSLALDTARLPSATRPTFVVATGYFQIVNDGTDLDGSVEIRAEDANPPTVAQCVNVARINAAAGTHRIPWTLMYIVPAGHRYMVAKTVETGVTCVLSKITEQAG